MQKPRRLPSNLSCPSRFALVMVAAFAASIAGCQTWEDATARLSKPGAQLSSRSVPLANEESVMFEIAVRTLSPEIAEKWEQAWLHLDSQAIDLETRKRLDANGIRVGIAGTRLPRELEEVVNWSEPIQAGPAVSKTDHRSLVSFEKEFRFGTHKFRQLQPGAGDWIECSPEYRELAWKTTVNGASRSGVCQSASAGVQLDLSSISRGLAEFWIVPVIYFGEVKHRYEVGETDFLYNTTRNELPLAELGFACRLQPGQTLVMSGTGPPGSLGQQLFGATSSSSSALPARFLLIRAARVPDPGFLPAGHSTSRGLSTRLD